MIKLNQNGPIVISPDNKGEEGTLFSGMVQIEHPDGKKEYFNKSVALCACGNSSNKPFCDGTHSHQ